MKELQNGNILISTYPNIDYALIYRPKGEEWVAAYGYNETDGTWAQGHYFDDILKATRWIENLILPISYNRLSEIASLAIDGLIEDGMYEAKEYFRESIELDEKEAEYFGIEDLYEEEDEYDV